MNQHFYTWLKYTILCLGMLCINTTLQAQTASFTVNLNTHCVPSTATLVNTSQGNIIAVDWNFGDNSTHYTSLTPNIQHPYDNAGTYIITLIVTFSGNIKDTATRVINVYPRPAFTFFANMDSICAGECVWFSSVISQSNGVRSYFWDFGDGMSSNAASPVHCYTNNADRNYNVSLTLTDTNGCDSIISFNNYITVGHVPQADFTTNDTFFCGGAASATVRFTNTTDSDSNRYVWLFGDNSNSYLKSPSHTYTFNNQSTGYDVTLIATSPFGCADTITHKNLIHVGQFEPHISISDSIFCYTPATIVLTGTDNGATYEWTIDTNTYTSTYRSIMYDYFTPGEKTIYVKATSAEGCIGYDTLHIRIYRQDTASIHIDSMGCYPDFRLVFSNTTDYMYNDNLGLESVKYVFLNENDTMYGNTCYRDYKQYIIPAYAGKIYVTTPYGCELPPTTFFYQLTPPDITWKTITDSSHCGAHDVCFTNFYCSKKDSFDMNLTIYWDYDGDLNDSSIYTHISYYDTICHHYDTGLYTMCVIFDDTCLLYHIEHFEYGLKPITNFRYSFVQDCYSTFSFDVEIYDSTDANGNPVAGVKHDTYHWYNPDDPSIPIIVDGPRVQVPHLGLQRLALVTAHHLCLSDIVYADSVAYICPPAINSYSTLPEDSHLYCDTTKVLFQPAYQLYGDATMAQWYFGDAPDLDSQTTTGLIPPDSAVIFDFWQSKNNALFTQKGYFYNTIIAINDDSNNIYSPTYNRCKYCEDTSFKTLLISVIDTNMTDSVNICKGTSFTLYDSSICNIPLFNWGFSLHNRNNYSDSIAYESISFKYKNFHTLNSNYLQSGTVYSGIIYNDDSLGCYREQNANLYVNPSSKAAFVSGRDSTNWHMKNEIFCANRPDTFYLQDQSYTEAPYENTIITQRLWVVNGDSSYMTNPTYVSDTAAGFYNVLLAITNEYDCKTITNAAGYLLVKKINAFFSPNKHIICNTDDVVFTNTSSIAPTSDTTFICTWNWGDSTTSTSIGNATMKHHYEYQPGLDTIIVSLTIQCEDVDCIETFYDTIYMSNIKAMFTDTGHVFPCPGPVGRTITYQNSSTGNITWWKWNFGDTASGSANEAVGGEADTVIHNYNMPGYYDISLIVLDDIGCYDTLIMPQYVYIDGPVGDFSYTPIAGCTDLEVCFTPHIVNADTFIVNPNGANTITRGGTLINDTCLFTYTRPKPYVPYFYLIKWTNHNGKMEQCITEWRGEDTIWAIQMEPGFTTDSIYCPNTPVTFNNTTFTNPRSAGIDSVLWDFGNGNTSHDYDGNTLYSLWGTYNVNMHVYAKQCDTIITKPISVIELPQLAFVPDTVTDCGESNAIFTLQDSIYRDSIMQYTWLWCDGEQSSDYPYERSFSSGGSYPYKVEVIFKQSGCNATYYDTIEVINSPLPTAEYEADPWTCKYGDSIAFTDKSTTVVGHIISWFWDFDDNSYDSVPNPSHTYTGASGIFKVMLKITDSYGCEDTVIHEVKVLEGMDFPNIFTPNGYYEGAPCVFKPLADNGYFEQFSITIYNRWGNIVWEQQCSAPNCPDYDNSFWWNGCDRMGHKVSDGVYYWVVNAVPMSGEQPVILNGSVTVTNNQ